MKAIVICISLIGALCGEVFGMDLSESVDPRNKRDLMDSKMQPATDLYSPIGAVVRIHFLTDCMMIEKDSDDLYISIDDFLQEENKLENERSYSNFMGKYASLFITDPSINGILAKKIIPEFEAFKIDAACEVTGFYDEISVSKYLEYLDGRLNFLKMLNSLSAFDMEN